MAPSVHGWIKDSVKLLTPTTNARPGRFMLTNDFDAHADVVRRIELEVARGSFSAGAHTVRGNQASISTDVSSLQRLLLRTDSDEELALDVVHSLIGLLDEVGRTPFAVQVKELEFILDSGQSSWTIGDIGGGARGLVERLDPTVTGRADAAMASGTNAAHYLQLAWTEMRARYPNYDLAVDHANKAVEAAAQPIVSPTNPRATTGTIIRDIEAKPTKWTCALGTVEHLNERLRNIWTAQYRHGEAAGPIPNVDPDTAKAAIHDAITLVQWLEDGLIVRTT